MHDVPPPLALIVEDSPSLAQLLARMLQAQGYHTQIAATLGAAADALSKNCPQLITLDLQLPDGSGASLLQQLRTDPVTAALPVVVISGSLGQAPDVLEQAQAVIAKPFALAAFVAAVRQISTHLPRPALKEIGGACD